jgi:type II secretory pathway pseudopilin PulG
MNENKKPDNTMKYLIGCAIVSVAIGFLAVVSFFLIGILASIAIPSLLNATDKAKEEIVKENVSAAASTSLTYLVVKDLPAKEASLKTIEELNTKYSLNDKTAKSPFDSGIMPFATHPGAGVVTIIPDGNTAIIITGYDKHIEVLASKTVRKFDN